MILRWKSLGDWLDAMAPTCTIPSVLDRARHGDPKSASDLDSIALDLSSVGGGESWSRARSVAGGRVQVPAYLSGRPDHMIRRMRGNVGKRLEIYLSPMGSGMCSESMMRERARAILSGLSGLQASGISCDLYLILDTQGSGEYRPKPGCPRPDVDPTHPDDLVISVIPIESRPVDLAQLAGLLCGRGFLDHLAFPWAIQAYGFTGAFARAYEDAGRRGDPGALRAYWSTVRDRLGLDSSAVLIPRVGHHDSQVWSDPTAWMLSHVQQALSPSEVSHV